MLSLTNLPHDSFQVCWVGLQRSSLQTGSFQKSVLTSLSSQNMHEGDQTAKGQLAGWWQELWPRGQAVGF